MSLIAFKNTVNQLRNATNDEDRVEHLTEAVYRLMKVVEDHDYELQELRSKLDRLKK